MDSSTNQPKQAVALRYDSKDRAPKISAKGRRHLAEKILELARHHDIPIRQDKNLLQILSRLDLNREVPPEVYQVVAEILAFIYRFIYRLSNRTLPR
jgi:flagellar biosynthesis protein